MRSRIRIKGHPLHPILIGFPITFFISTLLFDMAGWWRDDISFKTTAGYLHILAIISAVVAAVPGLIDYLSVVPPKSSARKRGAKHGILNSISLLIFVGAFIYKKQDPLNPTILLLAEVIAVALMGYSGWLGGTLVHRNQIGIDHRYADAGKWKEQRLKETDGEIEIGTDDLLSLNQMMLLHVGKNRVVLGRTETGYVAFDDFCSHRGASLADGALICGVVQCPWHGSQFDCKTGEVKAGPAKEPIATYDLTERSGKLFLKMSKK